MNVTLNCYLDTINPFNARYVLADVVTLYTSTWLCLSLISGICAKYYEGARRTCTHARTHTATNHGNDGNPVSQFWPVKLTLEVRKILKTRGEDSFHVLKFSKKLVLRYGCVYVILTVNWL